jgi:AcrR family transcriptional regulator
MGRLLDAGVVVLRQRGYQAARVDDIVKAAATSHGTFYLYFANKEDLFRALALDVADAMVALAESLGPVGPDRDGYAELHQWMGRFADLYRRHRAVIQAWTEAETGASEFGRLGTELMTRFTQVLIDRIDQTSVVGVDPQIAALAMLAMIERFNYYLLSRQAAVSRDQMLDTLTTIAHIGLFGGKRRPAREAGAGNRPAREAGAGNRPAREAGAGNRRETGAGKQPSRTRRPTTRAAPAG